MYQPVVQWYVWLLQVNRWFSWQFCFQWSHTWLWLRFSNFNEDFYVHIDVVQGPYETELPTNCHCMYSHCTHVHKREVLWWKRLMALLMAMTVLPWGWPYLRPRCGQLRHLGRCWAFYYLLDFMSTFCMRLGIACCILQHRISWAPNLASNSNMTIYCFGLNKMNYYLCMVGIVY